MKFFKYLFRDTVSTVLLFLSIVAIIGFFTKNLNMTPLLAITAMYLIFNTNEKGRLFERLYWVVEQKPEYKGILEELGLPPAMNTKRNHSLFDKIILILMVIASLAMAGMVVYSLLN